MIRWLLNLLKPKPRPGTDPQFGAERLACGEIRSFVDLPRGCRCEPAPLPDHDESGVRLWFYAPLPAAPDLGARLAGSGKAMGRKVTTGEPR